ncbi:PilW family protein [Aquabacterium sp. A7-Y]|uniref:PilW family protein n=1 Tax=Aquabacterium sp. A7-Y TaxID=1349605 RepID=UPI00223E27C1|nr:PilW family protein [Aquabacterium sp. A7-Y]MCW7539176.1 PilW family protein [Aquabacterium sp. A7-Y]
MSVRRMHRPFRPRQQGLSLVELLVAIAINLIVVAAAAYLYLASRQTQRSSDEFVAMNESGQFALEMLGRELENAGFYPAVRIDDPTQDTENVLSGYTNPLGTDPANDAFDAGLFGCNNANFKATTLACEAHASPAPAADTLVVNYYTNDALSRDIGQRTDCERQLVSEAAVNASRTTAAQRAQAEGAPPLRPLFVSNQYTLKPVTFNIDNQSISTFGLSCNGNGGTTADDAYEPVVAGIEELRFRYGVFTDATTLQPDTFLSAADVTSADDVVINGVARDGWSRVVAVEVCLVVRSLASVKMESADAAPFQYTDCSGTTQTPTDRVLRKVFRQVFAVRNHLSQTYPVTPND